MAVSKVTVIVLVVLSLCAIVATGLLVYFFAGRYGDDDPVDVTNTTPTPPTTTPPSEVTDVRLPVHLHPTLYNIKILAKFDQENDYPLHGEATIDLACDSPGSNVTLHAKNLNVTSATVTTAEGTELAVSDRTYDPERDFFIAMLDEDLEAGKTYRIRMEYRGRLQRDLVGYYLSQYDEGDSTRNLAVTKFQPTDARKAFPCFDEPDFKANFSVSLGRPNGTNWVALSNMNSTGITGDTSEPGYVWESFETSVPMSTYLVAFAVSEFAADGANVSLAEGEIPFKVWARPEMIEFTQKAMEHGPAILKYFEEYFDIPYPLPKMDMIALPDFASGAMENWGLVTYREEYLLYQWNQTSAATLTRIVYIIAHELAHMWFGDLVTPVWWNDLWLNEGFASYVMYLGSERVEPNWSWMDQFVFSDLQDVLYLDSLENSHSISVEVNNPNQISQIFDRISYAKGASVIRMMSHFLTEKIFKKGVSDYLKAFQYDNAVQDDLWQYLEWAVGNATKPALPTLSALPGTVKDIMDSWTLFTGYPVVNATREGQTVTFQQKRFLLNPGASEKLTTLWYIPLNVIGSSNSTDDFDSTGAMAWLEKTGESVALGLPSEDEDWYLVNLQQTGYYRVNYDDGNWEALRAALAADHTVIPTINRAGLLDDALSLARAGLLDYRVALNLTGYLGSEKAYIPWAATIRNFNYIRGMIETTGTYDHYKAYILSLLRHVMTPGFNFPTLEEVPKDGNYTDVTGVMYETLIWTTACEMGEESCVDVTADLFKKWKDNYDESKPDEPTLNPSMKALVYCQGVREGGEDAWEFIYKHYNLTNYASERTLVLQAMACTNISKLLDRYLDLLLGEGGAIQRQDVSRAFAYIAANPHGRLDAFKFVRDNWDYLQATFGVGTAAFGRFITPFSSFNTETELALLEFLKDAHSNELGSAERAMEQTIESVQINIRWIGDNIDVVTDWLKMKNSVEVL
ncbi:unnamed protein product [Darwinula stevensoni]|uniref:Aminopeptidase n=1 Tax=Darwinula stevensoni TaxID=69355 RepID=A0A7R8XAD8_9CRUS|nr:unnamed protein product [Darwinula stevensoni]CAG0890180.1 unnamed protein product [Darwinula stevensoni]